MKEYWSQVSYCLNNCLPSNVIVPNTHVFLCEPVVITIGRFPSGVHIFLINVSCMNMDSSSTATVKSSGMLEIISLVFF